jgi:hypothetical protein
MERKELDREKLFGRGTSYIWLSGVHKHFTAVTTDSAVPVSGFKIGNSYEQRDSRPAFNP